ncbi:MAG: hypothetical protein EXS55_00490 [Candidatus Magasanikbacteria bacterium]|nr:hypothetical protein [Candidatus Magasanikbacteria bacterium]
MNLLFFLTTIKNFLSPWFIHLPIYAIIIGAILLELLWVIFYLLTIDRGLRKIIGRHYGITLKPSPTSVDPWYSWQAVGSNNPRDRWIELVGALLFFPVVFVPPLVGMIILYWLRH